MTYKQYAFCIREVSSYSAIDAYVSDLSLSSVWRDAPDAEIPASRLDQLAEIYTAANRIFSEIIRLSGLSATKISERFSIPYRTIMDWTAGAHPMSLPMKLMIQECLGLYHPPIDF